MVVSKMFLSFWPQRIHPSVPLDSRLLLAPSQEELETTGRRLPDGNYYASEVIITNHEGVDLVILAACETLLPTLREVQGALGMTLGPESDEKLNIGQLELIVAGDEVVGLSRAFLSSGAQYRCWARCGRPIPPR